MLLSPVSHKRIIPGLTETYLIVERTNKAEIRPEKKKKKNREEAESCRENS